MQIETNSMSEDLHQNTDIKCENNSSFLKFGNKFNIASNLNSMIEANINNIETKNNTNIAINNIISDESQTITNNSTIPTFEENKIIFSEQKTEKQINYDNNEDRFEIQENKINLKEDNNSEDNNSEDIIDFDYGDKLSSLIDTSRKIKKMKKQINQ